MSKDPIISHIRKTESGWEIQMNDDHLFGVARLAEGFANVFGMGEWGVILYDIKLIEQLRK